MGEHINPCLVLVHPRKTHPDLTEILMTGPKESNIQTKTKKVGAILDLGCPSFRHNFVSAQYLENKLIEFHQIVNMHSYSEDLDVTYRSRFFEML